MVIATYKGIPIASHCGIYYPLIDPTVENENFSAIILWIDTYLYEFPSMPPIVDTYIIGEATLNKRFQSN